MHARALAYTPICLHTDTPSTFMLSRPHAGMLSVRTHMHTKATSAHFLTNIPLCSLQILPRGTSQSCVVWYCHLDTEQHSSLHPCPPMSLLLSKSLYYSGLTERLHLHNACYLATSQHGMNRLLVIFLQPYTVFGSHSLQWPPPPCFYPESVLPLLRK